jgi:hypothetical protein
MSEAMIVTIAATVVAILGVVCFALFHVYRGVHDTLSNAKVGVVYNFEYEQPLTGEPERYMAKVLQVSNLSEDSIRRLNRTSRYRRHDGNFVRTTHLVTAQTPDGKIRNFYAERTRNVRRLLLGRVLFNNGTVLNL